MNKAITTVPATEKLRYSDMLQWQEKKAVATCAANNIDDITIERIEHLLSWDGQQALRKQRNIGNVSLSRIRLWLAFHPNRRTWEAASGKLYDELNEMGIDPDQPAEDSK